ncbi:hypothetical protein HKX48_008738 [Thoreauomyces humboldtii]|nr:hypothetical protein HKX48_008738 [Thoreauomyces humboldtii]
MLRELSLVFPDLRNNPGLSSDLLVIPTFQQSVFDLVSVTNETQWERDLLLDYIHVFALAIVTQLRRQSYWADLTDPASGYPAFSEARGISLYPDVDGCVQLLGYQTVQAGCCRVITHPSWGTRNYPATIFCAAPVNVVTKVIEECVARPLEIKPKSLA